MIFEKMHCMILLDRRWMGTEVLWSLASGFITNYDCNCKQPW